MSVDLTQIDPNRVTVEKNKSVDLTQIPKDRISTQEKRLSDYIPGAFSDKGGLTLKAAKGGLLDASPTKLLNAAKDVKHYALDPIAHGLDYIDAPIREAQNVLVNSPLEERLIPGPKTQLKMLLAAAKFAGQELIGQKGPQDAAKWDDIYNKSDIHRVLSNPTVENLTGRTATAAQTLSPSVLYKPESDMTPEQQTMFGINKKAADKLTSFGLGMAGSPTTYGGGGLLKAAEKLPKGKVSEGLLSVAKKLTNRATGATGAEARNFKEGTAEFLLKNKIIKPFQNTEGLGQAAKARVDAAATEIEKLLKDLDAAGASGVNKRETIAQINAKIAELKSDDSTMAAAAELEGHLPKFTAPSVPETKPLWQAEQGKRNWQRQANYNAESADPAEKAIASIVRGQVENQAAKASPKAAAKFKNEKETVGFLAPVVEAAEKKAAQLQQRSPISMKDIATGLIATQAKGIPTGLLAAAGNHLLSPRLASTGAVSAYALANRLKSMGATPKQIESIVRMAPGLLNSGELIE